MRDESLLDLNLALVDFLLDLLGRLAFDIATNGEAGTENFLDGANELGGVGLGTHDLGDLADLVDGQLASVRHHLDLLSVARRRLESLQNEHGSGVNDSDFDLLVLHLNLDGDLHALEALGGLHDVFTDLLGGNTKGTELGRASGGGGGFFTDNLHVDVVNRSGVKVGFGRHSILFLPIY